MGNADDMSKLKEALSEGTGMLPTKWLLSSKKAPVEASCCPEKAKEEEEGAELWFMEELLGKNGEPVRGERKEEGAVVTG